MQSGIRICAVIGAVAMAACGRTDLEVSGVGGTAAAFGSGGRDGGTDAVAGRGSGGVGGSGGRVAATGGVRGTGGVTASGGRAGTAGRAGTGGRAATGGSGGTPDGGIRDTAVERPADAAAERPTIDAAGPDLPPSTPGTLTCGGQTCDTKSQSCCVSIAVGSVGAQCIPITSTCGGAALACDEPADCAGGTCCFGLQTGTTGGVAIGSRCVAPAACAGLGRFVVCRTNSDCARPNPACCLVAGGVPVCQPACR